MWQKVTCSNDKISYPAVMAMKGPYHASEVSLSLKSETKQRKKVEGGCSHCCNPRHTKKTCFKLYGYPHWWHELKEKKASVSKKGQGGQAHLAGCSDRALGHTDRAFGYTTLAPHVKGTDRSAEKGNALVTQTLEKWVIDSGATDHMTYLDSDIDKIGESSRECKWSCLTGYGIRSC